MKINHKRTGQVKGTLLKVPRVIKSIGAESRMEVVLGWEKGGMEWWCLMGTGFELGKMKSSRG